MDFEQLITDARNDAWQKLMKNPYGGPLYLYYYPSTETEYGQIIVDGAGRTAKIDLVCAERIPASLTKDQLRVWIRSRCMNIPLLPWGG